MGAKSSCGFDQRTVRVLLGRQPTPPSTLGFCGDTGGWLSTAMRIAAVPPALSAESIARPLSVCRPSAKSPSLSVTVPVPFGHGTSRPEYEHPLWSAPPTNRPSTIASYRRIPTLSDASMDKVSSPLFQPVVVVLPPVIWAAGAL